MELSPPLGGHVRRHTGGLEVYGVQLDPQPLVRRHTGGLEVGGIARGCRGAAFAAIQVA